MSTMLDLAEERDKLKKEYEYIITRYDDMCYNCDECKEQRLDLISKESDVNRRISEIEDKLSKIDSGERNKKLKEFAKLKSEEIRNEINKETGCSIITVRKLWSCDLKELVGLELYDFDFFPREIKSILKYFKNCNYGVFTPNEKDSDVGDMIYLNIDIKNWDKD